jgi:UDP-glucose 4-epimerase
VKAMVTGGAGFVGSHIVDALVAAGHDVSVVDNLAGGRRHNVNPAARFYAVDIGSPEFARLVRAESPEVVFHQAAQMSVKVSTDDPRYDAQVNALGLVNVLESCVAAGVRKVVFASSGATYGNPVYLPLDEGHPQLPGSPYGITKLIGEHYLRYYASDRGLRYTALRYGNVYGPRQDSHGEAGVVAIFVRQLLSGQVPVIHWDGEQVRDYVYVADVARANLLAAGAGDDCCICIGTGVGTSVNRLYELLCQTLGVSVTPGRAPRRAGDLRTAVFATGRASRELGWSPSVPLAEGLRRTVEGLRADLLTERQPAAAVAVPLAAGASPWTEDPARVAATPSL